MRFKRTTMRFVAGGITAMLGALLFASSATASSHNPTGEYAQFAECPMNTPAVEECLFSVTEGGSVTIGEKTVPLKNPVTLQGGLEQNEALEFIFVGAENGDTLSKTPQPVPGGLVGVTAPKWWPKFLQDWFNNLISEGFTGVDAIVELAAPANKIKLSTANLINQEGTALGLPVKVKLENPILGSNCYIGSNTKQIQINATTGTSGFAYGRCRDGHLQPDVHDRDGLGRETRRRHLRGIGCKRMRTLLALRRSAGRHDPRHALGLRGKPGDPRRDLL